MMKPCRIDIPGSIPGHALVKHRVCLLDTDSGAGKTLFFDLVSDYCSIKKLSYSYIDYRCVLDTDSILRTCIGSALVLFDNADLYNVGDVIQKLDSRTKLIFVSGHNLSLDNILVPDIGYYQVFIKDRILNIKAEWGA